MFIFLIPLIILLPFLVVDVKKLYRNRQKESSYEKLYRYTFTFACSFASVFFFYFLTQWILNTQSEIALYNPALPTSTMYAIIFLYAPAMVSKARNSLFSGFTLLHFGLLAYVTRLYQEPPAIQLIFGLAVAYILYHLIVDAKQ